MPTCRQAGVVAGGLLALVTLAAAAGPFEDGIAALQRSDFAAAIRLLRPLAESGTPTLNSTWVGCTPTAKVFRRISTKRLSGTRRLPMRVTLWRSITSAEHMTKDSACLRTISKPSFGTERLLTRGTRML